MIGHKSPPTELGLTLIARRFRFNVLHFDVYGFQPVLNEPRKFSVLTEQSIVIFHLFLMLPGVEAIIIILVLYATYWLKAYHCSLYTNNET